MKIPGPDHPITITAHSGRVRVSVGGKTIAETTRALALKEASYQIVFYIPREDVDFSALVRTDHHTHCPYKGDASYYSVIGNDGTIDNAVWSYETPYPAMAEISGHLAFYRNKVTIEAE
jgi:uncharacterized protein (DUF427 family)